jgi:hypothetical protein
MRKNRQEEGKMKQKQFDRKTIEGYESLAKEVAYDPETGEFSWTKTGRARNMSKQPGCINGLGYRAIGHKRMIYTAHRLAWVIAYGELPDVIDHINRDRADNRLCNLRNGTHAENLKNQPRRRKRYGSKNKKFGIGKTAAGDWRLQIIFHSEEDAYEARGLIQHIIDKPRPTA